MYISEVGGLRPTGKSFRFVRACARSCIFIDVQLLRKSQNKKIIIIYIYIKITIHKCVQERKIDSNPTHYTKFDKSTENHATNQDMV